MLTISGDLRMLQLCYIPPKGYECTYQFRTLESITTTVGFAVQIFSNIIQLLSLQCTDVHTHMT